MSLISDALKKAERIRLEQSGVLAPGARAPRRRAVHAASFGAPTSKLLFLNAALLVVALVLMVIVLRRPQTAPAAAEIAADPSPPAAAVTSPTWKQEPAASAPAATKAPADSPFAPPAAASAPAAEEPLYDLTGVTVMGQGTLVGLTRRSDGRSIWLNVGQSHGAVTVVSYDAAAERAVLRVDGREVTAAMHNPSP